MAVRQRRPRYVGYVTGGATPASILGDRLTSAYDQNAAAGGDSAAVHLEREVVGWLAELLGLGTEHRGALVTGATMSTFVGLAVAREWLGDRAGISVTHAGVCNRCPRCPPGRRWTSTASPRRSRLWGRAAGNRCRQRRHCEHCGRRRPACGCGAEGAVPILAARGRCFGAFAARSPQNQGLVDGLAEADSVCAELHKWMNVPYAAAVQFTRRRDLRVAAFHNVAAYLPPPTGETAFQHLTPENSRRLRALPAWFSLVAYGRDGHREIVERTSAAGRPARRTDSPRTRDCDRWHRSASMSSAARWPTTRPRNGSTPLSAWSPTVARPWSPDHVRRYGRLPSGVQQLAETTTAALGR